MAKSGKKQKPRRRRDERLGICLTLCPSSWLPAAVPLATGAAYVRFQAKIYRCDKGRWIHDSRVPTRRIQFDLYSSRERGVCLNYPVKGSNAPDLWFPKRPQPTQYDLDNDVPGDRPCPTDILDQGDNPPHNHFQRATTRKRMRSARVRVRCEDFGAYGWLVASAPDCEPIPPREVLPSIIPGCVTYSPTISALPTDTLGFAGVIAMLGPSVTLPRDDAPYDHIADSATDYNGFPNLDIDLRPRQTEIGGATPTSNFAGAATYPVIAGDGLSTYEEYRGFMVDRRPLAPAGYRAMIRAGLLNIHIRCDPNIKDVFVRDQHRIGIGYFRSLGAAIHRIRPEHYNGDYAPGGQAGPGGINPPPGLDQPDLTVPGPRVVNFNGGYANETIQHGLRLVNEDLGTGVYGESISSVGPPGTVHRVAVNVTLCVADGLDIAAVIAHELGHAVAIPHHGERLERHQARTRNMQVFLTTVQALTAPLVLVQGGMVQPVVATGPGTPFSINVTSPVGIPAMPSPILSGPFVLRTDPATPVTMSPVLNFTDLGPFLAYMGWNVTGVAVVEVPAVWLAVPWAVVVPRNVPGPGPSFAAPVNMPPVPVSAALVPHDLALLAGSLTATFICGPPGWATSGDMDCVMRYNFEQICHQHTVGPFPPYIYTHFAAHLPEGTMFCVTPLGTGRNLVGNTPCDFAQDADPARGTCRQRHRIHD